MESVSDMSNSIEPAIDIDLFRGIAIAIGIDFDFSDIETMGVSD